MSRLQTRLIAAFVVVLLIPTALISIYGTVTISNQLVSTAADGASQSNTRIAESIAAIMERARSDTLFLSRFQGVINYVDTLSANDEPGARAAIGDIQSILLTYAQNLPIYTKIAFVDGSGQEVVRVEQVGENVRLIPRARLTSLAEDAVFRVAFGGDEGDVHISPVTLTRDANGQVITPFAPSIQFASPVLTSLGTTGGVIVLTMRFDPISALVAAQESGAQRVLVDATDGTFLAGPNPDDLFSRDTKNGVTLAAKFPQDAPTILGAGAGTLLDTANAPNALQAFTPVNIEGKGDVRWTLLYTQNTGPILNSVYQSRLVSIALAVISLLLAVAVATVITRTIVRPITALNTSAIAIASGDLTQKVSIAASGEIGTLAQSFNKMSEQLAISYTTLERRVQERTSQLAEATHAAEDANRAKSVFLSNMSHELRTPLNVIIGYTSSMLNIPAMYDNLPLPSIYRRDIQLIMDNGHYLLGLINDILDLSKIEAGRLTLNRVPTDLNDILRGVISTAVGLSKDKHIQIRPDYGDDLPAVMADPMRVRQIILNLISNAIKFTERGSVTLQARPDGEFVRISVIDTGIGIPEAALQSIFDRFAQARQAESYRGTGLGLDISRHLTEMHGGMMLVQSKEGEGSTFTFTLPISAEPAPAKAAEVRGGPARIFAEPTTPSQPVPQHTVLVVEDEAATRDLVRTTLEDAGYLVVEIEDGALAYEAALGLLPEVIVLDIDMPATDGWAVLRQIREHAETMNTPIIVSATGEPPTAARRMTPADLFLAKPFSAEKLLEAVAAAIKVVAEP